MVKIRPFKAIRPDSYDVDQVASLPYDVINDKEARLLSEKNKKSFLYIDRAEIDLPRGIDPHDEQVYKKAQSNLEKFLSEGWLIKEEKPAYYLYRLKRNGHSQYGIVMTIDIEEYFSNQVKRHEFTRPDKELDRIRHIDACDANMSPIFLTYSDSEELNRLIIDFKNKTLPMYAFDSYYEVEHYIWKITEDELLIQITELFANEVVSLYIADGHHRMEAAAKVSKKRKETYPNADADANFNYFLGVAFPESQLEILPYNRLVKGKMTNEKWRKLREAFEVEEVSEETFEPTEARTIGVYADKKWFKLTIKETMIPDDIVGSLDVSFVQDHLLQPLFGIEDPRTDLRIEFVGGIHDTEELMARANEEENTVAISFYPTSIKDLKEVADKGETMPPKSTWFEPKLLSGLFLYPFESAQYQIDSLKKQQTVAVDKSKEDML